MVELRRFLFEIDRNGDRSGICVNLCNVAELQTKGRFFEGIRGALMGLEALLGGAFCRKNGRFVD